MSDTGRSTPSLGLALRGLAVVALAAALAVGLLADGRTQTVALALVPVWLLCGLLFVGVRRARETGRLPHHLAFAGVLLAGSAAGSAVWAAASGAVPAPVAAALGGGAWLGALGLGRRVVYGGPLDRALRGVGGAD